jgi:3-oxoacyl-[acyl-carrier-protein] synthase-1
VSFGIEVAVVAARTPVGLSAESSAAAVRAGISRRGDHPVLVDAVGEPLRCARDAVLDRSLGEPARLSKMVKGAATELIEKLGAARLPPPTALPVFLATPDARPGLGPRDIAAVAGDLREAFAPYAPATVQTVSGGHAAGLVALELAIKQLTDRRADLCVVGGADGLIDAPGVEWLEKEKRLARAGVRGGITPGEAAAMLVLCRREARARSGLPCLARVRGVATGLEPRSPESDEGLLGEGLTEVVRRAARDLRLPDEPIDDVYCDLNGERHRSDEWGFTVLRASAMFRFGARNSTGVAAWGDVGAASAPLGCVLAAAAWQRGYARGPRALVWASSNGGLRGAVVLENDGA